MTLTNKIIGAITVSLFVFALITFGYQAQLDNNVNNTIFDDPHLAGVNDTIFGNLSDIRGEANTQKDNFFSDEPQTGQSDINILTIPSNAKKFVSMMFASFNLVTGLLGNVFGVPSMVFNVLGGLMVIITLLLAWRVIKAGGT